MRTIPDESKNSSSIALPFGVSCPGFFFLGDDGDFQVADCGFSYEWYRKRHVSSHLPCAKRSSPNFFQNLTFSRCLKRDILDFRRLSDNCPPQQ
jgi:hypothetical protein